ncbi:MAG: hypothetical protein MJZ64_05440 [Paludibacteraceae bacterium]|nr:hypothetical protein [Paludibacteraceae bacterium]
MAKIKPMGLIESMSGKVCTHSDVYFRTNKRTGAVCSGKLCNPYTGEPSTNQTAARTKFANAIASAKAILAAKSTDEDQSNYTKLQTYTASYKADNKFAGTLFNFIMKKEYEAAE